ncbi:dicarboxylate carrier SLC25A8-like isoform X2 [Solea solea]|uniref:dicarboxylate carrier SLC25A8-like isoform X2 n=1 Tax=Solea solea TaxID=90069 RepID=UPI00272CBB4C|nr:dicarboxylate carrier SLC25A8-like isoform X2 [Solea solea]
MVGTGAADLAPSVAVKVFAAGTAACVADLVTFPLDTAKVRLQIQGEAVPLVLGQKAKFRGVFGTIFTMVTTEGPRSLYSGLVAGLHRQMSFASVRIGLYDTVKQFYSRGSDNVGIGIRLLAGCTTGGMAVAFAQPTDVVKVRFQAQVRLPESGSVKRYNSTMDAYKTIARDEGIRGLWKASPVDVVKTRFMNSVPGQYNGALNCALTMLIKEGPTAFYKGFVPAFLRLGSWNIVMFVSFEQIKRAAVRFQQSI